MSALMSLLHLVARFTCEGTPDRCLVVCGEPFPLCVRCMAVYAGLVLALAALFAVPRLRRASVSTAACYASYAGLLLMGLMGSLAVFADLDSPAWVRLAVGAIFGVSIAVLVKGRLAAWFGIQERADSRVCHSECGFSRAKNLDDIGRQSASLPGREVLADGRLPEMAGQILRPTEVGLRMTARGDTSHLALASALIIGGIIAAPSLGAFGACALAAVSLVGCLAAWGGIIVLTVAGFVFLVRRVFVRPLPLGERIR